MCTYKVWAIHKSLFNYIFNKQKGLTEFIPAIQLFYAEMLDKRIRRNTLTSLVMVSNVLQEDGREFL